MVLVAQQAYPSPVVVCRESSATDFCPVTKELRDSSIMANICNPTTQETEAAGLP